MSDAKEYLKQIRLYDTRINAKIDELSRLQDMVLKITPTLRQDAGSGGGNQDKLGDAIAKIVDLEAEINRDIDYYVNSKREVSRVIDKVTDPKQFAILHKRYIQYKTWEQIALEMHYTYRWVCINHGKALLTVEKILKK